MEEKNGAKDEAWQKMIVGIRTSALEFEKKREANYLYKKKTDKLRT